MSKGSQKPGNGLAKTKQNMKQNRNHVRKLKRKKWDAVRFSKPVGLLKTSSLVPDSSFSSHTSTLESRKVLV